MLYLIAVSVLWAFSFGIIGSSLSGVDSNFSAATRLGIACLCFLPFFRPLKIKPIEIISLVAIGSLQLGVMYVAYMRAFSYLPSHLVALFSVLTPLYIAISHDLINRQWHWSLMGCALLSIGGAVIIKFSEPSGDFWFGFALMQIANIAFGLGQLLYRNWKYKRPNLSDHEIIAALYVGGTVTAIVGFFLWGDAERIVPTSKQWYILLYLGAVASGFGFFWWNKGSTKTSASVLAASNNAVVPIAMALSLFVFGEASDIDNQSVAKLLTGAALIFGAIAWGRKSSARSKA
ncbi:EamA family transporter [Pelagicoccus albus]|uniref:EamA family transporter n=1 Tax=Pelagicoccus albus TaxID=415222 RepID=A0A7X1E944_9BACT|nr:EamA family transporter [Pelagicoccus albus]MBC2606966.1 EamA family transporter [Pelagicoccus albus]